MDNGIKYTLSKFVQNTKSGGAVDTPDLCCLSETPQQDDEMG